MPVCCVVGCSATQVKNRGLSFFQIRRVGDAGWERALIKAVNRQDKSFNAKNARICSRHFTADCMLFSGDVYEKKELKTGSLPTLFMAQKKFAKTPTPRKPPACREPTALLEENTLEEEFLNSVEVVKKNVLENASKHQWLVAKTEKSTDVLWYEDLEVKRCVRMTDQNVEFWVSNTKVTAINMDFLAGEDVLLYFASLAACQGVRGQEAEAASTVCASHFKTVIYDKETDSSVLVARSKLCLGIGDPCINCCKLKDVLKMRLKHQEPCHKPLSKYTPLSIIDRTRILKALQDKRRRKVMAAKSEVAENSVEVSSEMHSSLPEVMTNQSFSKNTPSYASVKLFWEQQRKNAGASESEGRGSECQGAEHKETTTAHQDEKHPLPLKRTQTTMLANSLTEGINRASRDMATPQLLRINGNDVASFQAEVSHRSVEPGTGASSEAASNSLHTGEKEKPYQCRFCEKAFTTRACLTYHRKTHPGEKPYQCDVCEKSFRRRPHLARHVRKHTGEKPYKCVVCERAFDSRGNLKNHSKTHIEKAYQCDVCEKLLSSGSKLRNHMRTHTGEKPYQCDFCEKAFTTRDGLTYHKKTHTGENLHQCDMCEKSFPTRRRLADHVQTHTGEKPYKCVVCEKAFISKSALKTHNRTHTGEKPYHCDVCGKLFSSGNGLKNHMRTHAGEKPYQCDICEKAFTIKAFLTKHIAAHTGAKPYQCDVCEKSFSERRYLQYHIRTHTGEKPYQCDICGRAFNLKDHLTTHIRTHTGAKPYQCDMCEKSFRERRQLKVHIRTHTGEKPYQCDVCGKQFSRNASLIIHLRTHTLERNC